MKILRPEIVLDIFWLAFCIGYVGLAFNYPPAGRLVPITIGAAGIAFGLVHFSGNFIRVIRQYTHGDVNGENEVTEESDVGVMKEATDEAPAENKFLAAISWAVALILGIVLLGAIWIMPVFFTIYFGVRGKKWGLGIFAGICMGFVAWGVFGKMINLQLPPGVITMYIVHLFIHGTGK